MRAAFVSTIIPPQLPSPAEVRKVLRIFGMSPEDLRCAYCGDKATEWDHLNSLVRGKEPSGYPSSIRNLVPSCGKCNQSRGSTPWREWMLGSAKLSPKTRGVVDLNERINRLACFERWAACKPISLEKFLPRDKLVAYWETLERLLVKMNKAEKLAIELRGLVQKGLSEKHEKRATPFKSCL